MTIANQLIQINTTKQEIKTAIENKGVSMADVPFTSYPSKINEIQGGAVSDWNYVRPIDWLALPTIDASEQKFVGLYAVTNDDSNYVALGATGAYTVDWGDGVVENFATNVKASHQYTYASISDTTLSSRGYKQVIITVTPQAGNNLTKVDIQQRHPSVPSTAVIQAPWLDIAVGSSFLSTIVLGSLSLSVRADMLEQLTVIKGAATVTTSCAGCVGLQLVNLSSASVTVAGSAFYGCTQLRKITGLNTAGQIGFSYMFYNCTSLLTIPSIDLSNANDCSNMFAGCTSLVAVPALNTSKCTTFLQMFSGCISLISVGALTTTNGITFQSMFSSCNKLPAIPALDTSKSTAFGSMFSGCYALTSIPALNTSLGTTFASTFQNCYSLTSIPALDTSKATSVSSMFSGCYKLQEVPISNTSLSNTFANTFNACYSLRSIPSISFSADTATALTSTFASCTNLTSFNATGIGLTFTVANCKLSAAALNNLYTNLPTVTGKTVTVTGNPGAAASDITIATSKGWTVTR